MILLNTPHNPVGKVFTRKEIETIADIAKEFNLLVISDEVVRTPNHGVCTSSDAAFNTVRLSGVRRRGTRPDRNPPRDVGEDDHRRLCGQ